MLLLGLVVQTVWSKYPGNPVMVKEGNFYESAIGSPSVILLRDTFYMYYAAGGQDTKGRISLAISTDGIHWLKYDSATPVFGPDSTGWDSHFLDTPEVLYDGQFKLYYFGDSDNDPPGGAIGLAVSSDGVVWNRVGTSPVLSPGAPGDWDGLFLESPTVLYDPSSGLYFMYFSGVDTTWRVRIGGAISTDGIVWSKMPGNPILTPGGATEWDGFAVATPTVLKRDTLFEMWYCGASVGDVVADGDIDTLWVGYATSRDGVVWTKHPSNPLLGTYTPPLDVRGPWAPDVLFVPSRGEFMMWYETAFGFSLATSQVTAIHEGDFGGDVPETLAVYSADGRKVRSTKSGRVFFVLLRYSSGRVEGRAVIRR